MGDVISLPSKGDRDEEYQDAQDVYELLKDEFFIQTMHLDEDQCQEWYTTVGMMFFEDSMIYYSDEQKIKHIKEVCKSLDLKVTIKKKGK